MTHELWAILAEFTPGKWNIVGIYEASIGHVACVNSNLKRVEDMWKLVSEDLKLNHKAKIVKFESVNEGAWN